MLNRVAVALGLLAITPLVVACSGASTSSSSAVGGSAGAAVNSGGTVGVSGAGTGMGGSGASGGSPSGGGAGAGGASAAASGGAGTAGAAACSGPLEEMVAGLCVAKSVAINGGYSIDATEVTQGQYAAWLASSPALPSASDPTCGSNTSYAVIATCLDSTVLKGDEYPISCVDWCDAKAYCAGVGKRLCGKIGGGENATSDVANADTSQWYRACSSGGINSYPYGNTRDGSACNGYDHSRTELPVGSLSTCQSSVAGYQGVYDLAGNVGEWEDSCDDTFGPNCLIRGGATVGMTNCDAKGGLNPMNALDDTGFRCCSQ